MKLRPGDLLEFNPRDPRRFLIIIVPATSHNWDIVLTTEGIKHYMYRFHAGSHFRLFRSDGSEVSVKNT